MQVVCVKAFGMAKPGDLAEVPDGARMDPAYWAAVPGPGPDEAETPETPETPPEPPSPVAPAAFPPVATLTEM